MLDVQMSEVPSSQVISRVRNVLYDSGINVTLFILPSTLSVIIFSYQLILQKRKVNECLVTRYILFTFAL